MSNCDHKFYTFNISLLINYLLLSLDVYDQHIISYILHVKTNSFHYIFI